MNRITVNNGDVLVQVGGRIGKTLTVTALRLEQFKELASGTSYLANIHIEASKQDGNFLGAKVITRDVPIQLRTHITSGVTAQIDGCLTSGGKKGYKNFLESYKGLSATCTQTQNFGWSNQIWIKVDLSVRVSSAADVETRAMMSSGGGNPPATYSCDSGWVAGESAECSTAGGGPFAPDQGSSVSATMTLRGVSGKARTAHYTVIPAGTYNGNAACFGLFPAE